MGNRKKKVDVRKVFASEEVLLKDLFLIFWERKRYLFLTVSIFLGLSIIAILTTPTEYQSTSTRISEVSEKKTGGGSQLSRLSGLAGIDLGAGSSNVNLAAPSLYPRYVSSQPFLLDLMHRKFYFKSQKDSLSLYNFYRGYSDRNIIGTGFKYLMQLPNEIRLALIPKENKPPKSAEEADLEGAILKISRPELKVMKMLSERIIISSDGKFITVDVIMPETELSAQVNEYVFGKLIDFVTEKKTLKERRDLEFVELKTSRAKVRFEEIQDKLARYADANRGIVSAAAEIELKRLESEFNIHFNIYNTLAVQVEQTRLKLEEETPLYSEFEPVFVPHEPSNSYKSTIILYIVLGFFVGFVLIVWNIYRSLMNEGEKG